ncbi:hypothetical protein WDV06_22905 [Streptomyces racemochromogenes]|uniref:Methyltransferase n=1 Tax=Streptomyces racemochromogenes TaxID=67353 RepID=A0ABW7PIW0_9ACTN
MNDRRAAAPAGLPVVERLVELSTRLQGMWDAAPSLVFPGWGHPFRALGELLPERDVLQADRHPQMVPLMWYPALRSRGPHGEVVEVFDHLPGERKAAALMLGRRDLAGLYGWAVITASVTDWIRAALDGAAVLEVGAGSGYWARQLSLGGLDVLATDLHRVEANGFTHGFRHAGVEALGAVDAVRRNPGRTLLLVWPPPGDPMAADALRAYRGDTFLYAGEGPGGMCADADFFTELDRHWIVRDVCPLTVRWLGHGDTVTLYRRR